MKRWTILSAMLLCLAIAPRPAEAVIQVEQPLKTMILGSGSGDFIFLAKVTRLDPARPTMVVVPGDSLKGKAPWERMPVNLKGEEKDIPKLLKRLADDLPVVVFVTKPAEDKPGDTYKAMAYTNGTWFSLNGHVDGTAVRWVFVQCEPNFRKTFHGTTEELTSVVKLAVARKKAPPPLDSKAAPGLGPEVERKGESGQ
jgi:hypothetical protein